MTDVKTKNYVVRIVAVCDVLVIAAKDEPDAMTIAGEEVRSGDFQILESSVKSEPKTAQDLESASRHADKISRPN